MVRAQVIDRGPVPYGDVVELALYHPEHGFYASGGHAGRRGDFITSPEVGPLFGATVALAIDREWDRLGQPDRMTVIDAGAGPGTLARSVLFAEPRCLGALDYVCVEVSSSQRRDHPSGVRSLEKMPDTPVTGMIIANELLDNLAFTPLEHTDDGWVPLAVREVDGRLVEALWPEGDTSGGLETLFDDELARAVHEHGAIEWMHRALGSVLARGRLVVIDYCREESADVAIRTYAAHGHAGDPLEALGTKDITVDVDLQQLQRAVRPADEISTQTAWLREHGMDALVDEGRRAWSEGASIGNLDALRARSRVREAEALIDPLGLGGFTVAQWVVG